jgi:cytochrome c biogenesis protein CcmG/thiol:disulfide interchange protein DsbE
MTLEATPGAGPVDVTPPVDVGGPLDVGGPVGGAGARGRHGRHTARWSAGLVLLVLAALVALLATRPPATATEVYSPLLGKTAPVMTGTTVTGQSFHLSSYRGRWVFVNFFASWCGPCQAEEPELVTFAYQHRAAGDAALVGVVYDDNTSRARAFEESAGGTWPSLVDPGGQIALRYGLRGTPETFLISPSGEVVGHYDGAVTASYLDGQLAEARAAGL